MNLEELEELVSYNLSFGILPFDTLEMFNLSQHKEYFANVQSSSASDSSSESK